MPETLSEVILVFNLLILLFESFGFVLSEHDFEFMEINFQSYLIFWWYYFDKSLYFLPIFYVCQRLKCRKIDLIILKFNAFINQRLNQYQKRFNNLVFGFSDWSNWRFNWIIDNLVDCTPKSTELLVTNISIWVYIDDLIDLSYFFPTVGVSLIIICTICPERIESKIAGAIGH